MKKWKILALLIGVVFISGCTTTTSGNGPSMTVSLSDSTVEPGTQAQLTVQVQNNGGATATGVHADLNGLTQDWGISPGTSLGIQDLEAADPSHNFPGGADSVSWTLTAPGLNTQISYPFSVRLNFNYETTNNAIVRIANSQYAQTNKLQTGLISSTQTGGPVTITVRAPNAVFGGSTIPIYFDFNNAGSGVVVGNMLNVFVSAPGAGLSCPKNGVSLIPDSNGVGRNGILRCTVSTAGVSSWSQFTVNVKADYSYYMEQFNSVTVLAKTS